MTEIDDAIARQAAWQETRRRLSWPVKIRMAEQLRDAVRHFDRAGGLIRRTLPTRWVCAPAKFLKDDPSQRRAARGRLDDVA